MGGEGPDPRGHLCRWRLGGIRSYNPEQIMLNAAVHRTSRDVSIMKEKLIFSGGQPRDRHWARVPTPHIQTGTWHGHGCPHTHRHTRPPHTAMSASWVVGKGDVQEWGGGEESALKAYPPLPGSYRDPKN